MTSQKQRNNQWSDLEKRLEEADNENIRLRQTIATLNEKIVKLNAQLDHYHAQKSAAFQKPTSPKTPNTTRK